MRFFVSFLQSRVPHPSYRFWIVYLRNGLMEAGHHLLETDDTDWAEGLLYHPGSELLSTWRTKVWSRTVEFLSTELQAGRQIDLALFYLFPQQVDPSAVSEIQRLGIPCVNFFCDNVREYTRAPREFGCFSLNWVPEVRALVFYRQAGFRHIHAPMPVWVTPAARTCEHQEQYGVSFIGSYDEQRAYLLNQVLDLGLKVDLRGAGWEPGATPQPRTRLPLFRRFVNQIRQVREIGIQGWMRKIKSRYRSKVPLARFASAIRPRPATEVEYCQITQESQVTLGINRYPSLRYPFYKPDAYSRLRDIEAPMMGACYLTEWTEDLDCLYDIGREVEVYRTADELVEKARTLQTDAARRLSLRRFGQKKALAEHTIEHSISKILNALHGS